ARDDVEDAAFVLDAGGEADDLDRHANGDLHVHEDAAAVEVKGLARDGVALQLADHRVAALIRSGQLEEEDGVLARSSPERVRERLVLDGDGDVRLPGAVHDARNAALGARPAGRAPPRPPTVFRVQ